MGFWDKLLLLVWSFTTDIRQDIRAYIGCNFVMVSDDELFSWVKKGRQRRVIVMAMTRDRMMPVEISWNTKNYGRRIILSNLTKALKKLVKAGIVICTGGSTTNGKLYTLRQKGKEFQEEFQTILNDSPLFKDIE